MNVALIFAGGRGTRMNTRSVPKQFLQLYGKEIIIHTLEQFENHSEIDGIVVVCIEGYIEKLKKLLNKHGIEKVAAIVPGGATGQDSIFNGLDKIHDLFPGDSVVLVHDGVRPMISAETISADIACVKEHGSAITVSPAQETIVLRNDRDSEIAQIYERQHCAVAKAPQCFFLEEFWQNHKRAIAEDRHDFIDSACLMHHYGHSLHTVEGATSNIKITNPSDYYVFRALVDVRETEQIMGL